MHANHIFIVEAESSTNAIDRACEVIEDFNGDVCDWYEVGGRWEKVEPFVESNAVSAASLGKDGWTQLIEELRDRQFHNMVSSLAMFLKLEHAHPTFLPETLSSVLESSQNTVELLFHAYPSIVFGQEQVKKMEEARKQLTGVPAIERLKEVFFKGFTPSLISLLSAINIIAGRYTFNSGFYDGIHYTAFTVPSLEDIRDRWEEVSKNRWAVNMDLHS